MALELLFPPIISQEGRKNILNHTYVPGTKSFMMPYLDPMWEYVIQFFPLWIAPNVITLIGCAIPICAFYFYCHLDPYFEGNITSSLFYILQFFSVFLYNTLDACDGKHARNTKNSSPLGQLFDHGCDAFVINTTVIHFGCMGIGTGWYMLCTIIMGQNIFYAMNWKARHTGMFDFGQFSVDELAYLGMALMLSHAIMGNSFIKELTLYGMRFVNLLIIALLICICWQWYAVFYIRHLLFMVVLLFVTFFSVKAFYEVGQHYESSKGADKRRFYDERFYELGNVILFHVAVCCWNFVDIFSTHPTMFVTTVSIAFAHLVHRLIICDVSKQKSKKVQYIILPYVMIGILAVMERFFKIRVIESVSMRDFKIIFAVLAYSAYVMIVYATRCMIDISNILKIRIFVINPPKKVK